MFFSGINQLTLPSLKSKDGSKVMVIKDFEYVYIPLMNMQLTNIKELVKVGDHVLVNQKVAIREDHFYLPIFSSVSGSVEAIEKRLSTNLVYTNFIKIKNDFKYEKLAHPYYDKNDLTSEDIISIIKENGITGAGGSGFPTYVKYENSNNKIDTIIINGVECEPYLNIDYQMMLDYPNMLLEGTSYLIKAAQASNAKIAFKKGKDKLIKLLTPLLSEYPEIEICLLDDVYPMGWERLLIRSITKKDYHKLPSEIGIVVSNSSTAIKIAQVINNDNNQLVALSLGGPALKNNGCYLVPNGTLVSDLIAKSGGYQDDVTDQKALLIAGGPMMGTNLVSDDVAINSYSNAINVLYNEQEASMACLRCSRCVDACPIGLQPVAIKDGVITKDNNILKKLEPALCIKCGLCSYICPSNIDVRDYVNKANKQLSMEVK